MIKQNHLAIKVFGPLIDSVADFAGIGPGPRVVLAAVEEVTVGEGSTRPLQGWCLSMSEICVWYYLN